VWLEATLETLYENGKVGKGSDLKRIANTCITKRMWMLWITFERSCIMGDQHSALWVKLADIFEGMDFQSDERSSFLNLTTGAVVTITDEE
jgi:hypothetical protein